MTHREFKNCGAVRLLDLKAEAPEDWDFSGATHVRVSLPAGRAGQAAMEARGFVFGDRSLDVEIRPRKTKIDYGRLVRIKPEAIRDHRRELLDIALAAFPSDRRFHVAPDYDPLVAAAVLEAWVDELGEVLICRLKEEAAGFLALRETGDQRISVHLAAVAEKYRSAGVALSLYAGAVVRAVEQGYETIEGRISSLNMPVMNLYAFLGASFANPRDVYLKVV
ncbi:MAG: GNAT family N-acetyltransferase [Candidatus Adiutrix sp.]|nr:GNAT family N-acetyltransferase [Candidatus Adiutrix sp.]